MKIKLGSKQVKDDCECYFIAFGRVESMIMRTEFQLKFTLSLPSRVPSWLLTACLV